MAVPTTDQLRENLCSRDPRNPYFADLYGDGKDPDNDPGPAAALPPQPALDAEFTSPGEPPCAS